MKVVQVQQWQEGREEKETEFSVVIKSCAKASRKGGGKNFKKGQGHHGGGNMKASGGSNGAGTQPVCKCMWVLNLLMLIQMSAI